MWKIICGGAFGPKKLNAVAIDFPIGVDFQPLLFIDGEKRDWVDSRVRIRLDVVKIGPTNCSGGGGQLDPQVCRHVHREIEGPSHKQCFSDFFVNFRSSTQGAKMTPLTMRVFGVELRNLLMLVTIK